MHARQIGKLFLRHSCLVSRTNKNAADKFLIGCFGTLTLQSGRYPAPDWLRLFVMVGVCGGFTTFSSFSLQTLELVRSEAWGAAFANVAGSLVLCLLAVAAGWWLGARIGATPSAGSSKRSIPPRSACSATPPPSWLAKTSA